VLTKEQAGEATKEKTRSHYGDFNRCETSKPVQKIEEKE
jgi:hypothetical protein